MGNWGLKISKEGHDVKTCSLEDQSFNSEHSTFIITMDGYVSITSPATGKIDTPNINYNLAFMGFMEVEGSGRWFAPYVRETTSGHGVYLDLFIDGNLAAPNISYATTVTTGTATTKIYLIALANITHSE